MKSNVRVVLTPILAAIIMWGAMFAPAAYVYFMTKGDTHRREQTQEDHRGPSMLYQGGGRYLFVP